MIRRIMTIGSLSTLPTNLWAGILLFLLLNPHHVQQRLALSHHAVFADEHWTQA